MSRVGQTALRGHGLQAEGAPHDEDGDRIHGSGSRFLGSSGEGRAKCACGELSEVLASAAERRRWHNAHKDEVRSQNQDK